MAVGGSIIRRKVTLILFIGIVFLFLIFLMPRPSLESSAVESSSLPGELAISRALLNSQQEKDNLHKPAYQGPKCSSCALVGTSGFLLDSNARQAIDSHDCVFRLGFSPVRGYSEHVGSKTTVRVVDSNRLALFLKNPYKLASGLYASDYWYVFGHRSRDSVLHKAALEGFMIKESGNVRFGWSTKAEDVDASVSLKRLAGGHHYSLWSGGPTAFWHTVKATERSGCEKLDIYGLPDPKICKKYPDLPVRSLYWDQRSLPLCRDGHDMGYSNNNKTLLLSQAPSLAERRAIRRWSDERRVDFYFPKWLNS